MLRNFTSLLFYNILSNINYECRFHTNEFYQINQTYLRRKGKILHAIIFDLRKLLVESSMLYTNIII